jgi:hypothetical protein
MNGHTNLVEEPKNFHGALLLQQKQGITIEHG